MKMKYLIHFYTIAAIGVIGMVMWGFWGLLSGLVVGYILVSLFGQALLSLSGGILPRKIRQKTAQEFLSLNVEWLEHRMPDHDKGGDAEFIEHLLEKVFLKAAVIGPWASSGMSYAEVASAVEILKSEEDNPNVIEILDRLWLFLEYHWWCKDST